MKFIFEHELRWKTVWLTTLNNKTLNEGLDANVPAVVLPSNV